MKFKSEALGNSSLVLATKVNIWWEKQIIIKQSWHRPHISHWQHGKDGWGDGEMFISPARETDMSWEMWTTNRARAWDGMCVMSDFIEDSNWGLQWCFGFCQLFCRQVSSTLLMQSCCWLICQWLHWHQGFQLNPLGSTWLIALCWVRLGTVKLLKQPEEQGLQEPVARGDGTVYVVEGCLMKGFTKMLLWVL